MPFSSRFISSFFGSKPRALSATYPVIRVRLRPSYLQFLFFYRPGAVRVEEIEGGLDVVALSLGKLLFEVPPRRRFLFALRDSGAHRFKD